MILLLHGALGAETQLLPLKNELEKIGHQVYTMNFSGHGGMPFSARGFGIEAFASDIDEFINRHNFSDIQIFGYSMGGYAALWYAQQYPEKINSIITLGTKFDWSPASAAREVMKVNPEKIQEKIPAFARILEHRHAPNDWKLLLNKTAMMMEKLGDQPLLHKDNLKKVSCQVTIAIGELDDMADVHYSKTVSSFFVNGKFLMLPGIPHPIEKIPIDVLLNLFGSFEC